MRDVAEYTGAGAGVGFVGGSEEVGVAPPLGVDLEEGCSGGFDTAVERVSVR